MQHVLYNLVEMRAQSASASTKRLLPALKLPAPPTFCPLSCAQITLFMCHVSPLLESIQERRQEGDMKREIAIAVLQ